MLKITFPDSNIREFSFPITGLDIANSISKSLAKEAIAIKVDGVLHDISYEIEHDAKIQIVTLKDEDGLNIIRHDTAHVLAQAVSELFTDTQVTIGPTIDNGFYYDFARDIPFTMDDLKVIENKMKEIVTRSDTIHRKVVARDQAIDFFTQLGEKYKVELIEAIPHDQEITLYSQGNFTDLCRGPHAPSTKFIKAFKLMKVAGAYWRGNSQNTMLQRIYGTAWESEERLQAYLTQIEEAERRDHRKIGKEMDLFHFQEDSPGVIFWHTKGWTLFQRLVSYIRDKQNAVGFKEVSTPEILDRSLWEESGHWEKYGQNMFTACVDGEDKVYALKPMSCPGCVQIFKQGVVSYRDLPLRLSEFGKVHRYEPSGALHGIMRVRGFTQDDAHVFCSEDQITSECKMMSDLILSIYKDFGFNEVIIKLSDRPSVRIGTDDVWDKAEKSLKEAMNVLDIPYTINPGEGAFYGPKLEFTLRDAIGRDWQLGTIQVDFNLPSRLKATYIGEDGKKHHPVLIHRAMFGSIERFLGILLEHFSGKLPLWLAPIQVVVATITSDVDQYAYEVSQILKDKGISFELDLENAKIGYKVRKHMTTKVPIILALGRQEMQDRSVCVRRLGSNTQEHLSLNEFVTKIINEIKIN